MIPLFKVNMPAGVLEGVKETLFSGYVGQGQKVEAFEDALSHWMGGRRPLALNSGTSALRLALRLAGVGPGDSVVSSPMSCMATNTPILEQYARPIWADIDPWTGNVDPESVARAIEPDTKAVIAVHWGGYPCQIDELRRITREREICLIEDAAHAFGATYRSYAIGATSDFVAFSFQAIKHLTTVDGGALTIENPELRRRGKLLRWYGIDREGARKDLRCEEDVLEAGYKAHMNNLAAAIGLEGLKSVGHLIARHRENAAFYAERFQALRGVRLLRYEKDRVSSYWLFTVRVSDREGFRNLLEKEGIMASQVHVRNDHHTCFMDYRKDLPGVDEFSKEQVSIPVGWWVSDEDRQKIARAVELWSEGA